jgi:hypothetical protein
VRHPYPLRNAFVKLGVSSRTELPAQSRSRMVLLYEDLKARDPEYAGWER